MLQKVRAFFLIRRGELKGVFALIIVIVVLAGAGYAYHQYCNRQVAGGYQTQAGEADLMAAYRDFALSVRQEEAAQRRSRYPSSYSASGRRGQEDIAVVLAPFDPNTADSLTLRQRGLPAWMVRNVLRYRAKGGKFRRPEDFRKLYGMSDGLFATLEPYLTLPAVATTPAAPSSVPALTVQTDTVASRPSYPDKYPAGTLVDLNRADTAELKRIPGIGSAIARSIVNYRQRLGGFYALEQLREINLDHRQLKDWFRIDPQAIRRINLNRVSVDRLRRHPYFNFYQAKAIVEYRQREGRLQSLKPFRLLEEFTSDDLARMEHYVCYE